MANILLLKLLLIVDPPFFNYKGIHSVILAVCDAHYRYITQFMFTRFHIVGSLLKGSILYRFILVDLCDGGRQSDGGVLSNSAFGQALDNNSLTLPNPYPLPGTTQELPYVVVGDEAFPLRVNMLQPFPGRNLPGIHQIMNILVCIECVAYMVLFQFQYNHNYITTATSECLLVLQKTKLYVFTD